jgi:chromosome segregation ATPase
MVILAASAIGDYLAGFAAFGTMLVLAFQAVRSWRKGPADVALTEAQTANERESFWKNALAEVRTSLAEAQSDADRANARVDQVTGQIDALRASKDEMELDLRTRMRAAEDRADALVGRVLRLEGQVRELGGVPVS